MRDDLFEKKVCRLCGTGERHTSGFNEDANSCTYWLEAEDGTHRISGYVRSGHFYKEFWMPVRYCPYCGKEL